MGIKSSHNPGSPFDILRKNSSPLTTRRGTASIDSREVTILFLTFFTIITV
jgi:hypothetical protein